MDIQWARPWLCRVPLPSTAARHQTLPSFATRWRMTGVAKMAVLPVPVWAMSTNLVRQARAVKTASIRILPSAAALSPERKCGSVRSVPRGSFVGRRPAHPGLWGAVFGALNRRTWGLKSRPVSITRLQRRTNRSLSGSALLSCYHGRVNRRCGC
jgi:hypothetical protein